MTDWHEAGMETRPSVLGDSHVDRTVAATTGLVAGARETGRMPASVAEAVHPDMNIDAAFRPASRPGMASAEAREFARAAAQGRGRK